MSRRQVEPSRFLCKQSQCRRRTHQVLGSRRFDGQAGTSKSPLSQFGQHRHPRLRVRCLTMSFEYAPVSKGLILSLALSTVFVGVFDVKHYFHLQLVPHVSHHHQYWRLATHHLAFASSSDLFVAVLTLYNVSVQIERNFGSLKFASFVLISTMLSTILEFVALILFHRAGLAQIPAGPIALIFSIIYQWSRIVPHSYQFRIFGVPLTNKSFTFISALQLAIGNLPGSAAAALIGLLAGQLYRSDLANLKGYRISPRVAGMGTRYALPLIGSLRPARRSTRALPDGDARAAAATRVQNEEIVTTSTGTTTTARPTAGTATQRQPAEALGGPSVMREWVEGLTGSSRAQPGMRIPVEAEITQLTTMFPDIQREVLVGTLQRSANIEGAVETLLSSQR
ncbi:unnamed protein product [Mycena citricolor]|uniref:CUE domain-containing protein n=1 Tax=Mycena citricolor TaxID=2018698 RepID=A0AAD2GT76_9AGAR|nr:unnamed protein product [Mycena citricolor]